MKITFIHLHSLDRDGADRLGFMPGFYCNHCNSLHYNAKVKQFLLLKRVSKEHSLKIKLIKLWN